MTYKIINTGSDGNATVVGDEILIDCGVSFKKLSPFYKKLKLVLLTHEHGDHFSKTTISRLTRERPTLKFGCCSWLVQRLIDCEVPKKNIHVYETGKKYSYKEFSLIPIKLYHDIENCGYRLFMSGKKMIYATDTRTLEGISAKNYDLYLIEANYDTDEELLSRADNNYYYERVRNTHLSKEQTDKWLLENMGDNSIYEFMHQHKNRG